MSANTNNVLYWSGTMLDNSSNVDNQIQQTNNSGFTNVLCWSLHVNDANPSKGIALGDLHWNDTPLVATINGKTIFDPKLQFTKLSARLNTLLNGGTVKNVFFSIGAGGTSDFTTIQKLLASSSGKTLLQNNFKALLTNLPMITGFDFDDEDNYDLGTVAGFTVFLVSNFNSIITYCPYGDYNFDFWESCMEKVYILMKSQPVAWWNLQCYSGGDGTDPTGWVKKIAANKSKNGVANPDAFIVPGYAAMNNQGDGPGMCPPDICKLFIKYQGKVPGGFIWNSQHVFEDGTGLCSGGTATIAQYADAFKNGLGGKCS